REAVRWGELVVGRVGDRALVPELLRSRGIEAVVHFAAFAYVGESVEQPGLYFQNNVVETLGLLESMREAGVTRIVFSSTCATYGQPIRLPLDEDHPQAPVSPYGETKLAVEWMLRAFERAHGLRWIALRYFNAAGAHPDGTLGELHEPETHLIPSAIFAALGRRSPLELFGTDYPTADGTAIRDYVHVVDLALAHRLAVERLARDEPSIAVNLGTGAGHSVREVLAAVERATGRPVPRVDRPRRPGDPASLVADPSRSRTALAWIPARSSLDDIVADAYAFLRAR
ncbi:MAG: UDP-glucose 4-epimerase GalE, partial [Polyangiales bacterium]